MAQPSGFTRLDPRARFALALLSLLAAPLVRSPAALALLSAAALALPRALRLPRGFLAGMVRLAALPMAFIFAAHILYGPGAGWLPRPSLGGALAGALQALRFWLGWCAFSLFWATTSPDDLLRALRSAWPRVPRALEDAWLGLELTLRFAPLLGEEADRLLLARAARGELPARGAIARASQAAGLVVPLTVSALRRAESLADTLVARGFGSGPATSAASRRFGAREWLALFGAAAALAALLALPS